MTLDRNAKILMAVFTFALILNGLAPWLQPHEAGAKENTAISENIKDTDCSFKNLEGANNLERLLGYIEASVNDIQLTVKGIDRKMDALPLIQSADRG